MLKQRVGEDGQGDVRWIVETRGRVFAGTTDKDRAMEDWCERASDATAEDWRFLRVNQADFDPVAGDLHNFAELVATCGLARLATVEKSGRRASPPPRSTAPEYWWARFLVAAPEDLEFPRVGVGPRPPISARGRPLGGAGLALSQTAPAFLPDH